MDFQIGDSQTRVLHLNPLDRAGNVTTVDGVPVWSSENEAALTIEIAADGLSAKLIPSGTIGTFGFTVTADVNMDPDVVENISETHTVTVVTMQATGLGLVAESPVDKP